MYMYINIQYFLWYEKRKVVALKLVTSNIKMVVQCNQGPFFQTLYIHVYTCIRMSIRGKVTPQTAG